MDPKPKGSTVHKDFDTFTCKTGHSWQPIRRDTWQKERPNGKMGMTMKERNQSYRMMKERNQSCQTTETQGFKTERIMKKRIQERLSFGDGDTTIWGGLNGV